MKRGVATAALLLCGCRGPQSALDPAGAGAQSIASLFWVMAAGAAAIWLAMAGLILLALRDRDPAVRDPGALFIIGGGALVPTLVLAVLLGWGLSMLPELVRPAAEPSPNITVVGEQWWWRVTYETPDGGSVELANEIHLPLGEDTEFRLESRDVIHAFWVPALGGKVDMIPGRTTRLRLEPTRPGAFRGVCAEYCGTSHAWMFFDVVVEEPQQYEQWLARESSPAVPPASPLAQQGLDVFRSAGCGACHRIRGTQYSGRVGPDLTHFGSRRSLAAGVLKNDVDDLARWLRCPQCIKPDAKMPAFDMLSAEDLQALAAYLKGLE